jgi:hypothetical protein
VKDWCYLLGLLTSYAFGICRGVASPPPNAHDRVLCISVLAGIIASAWLLTGVYALGTRYGKERRP